MVSLAGVILETVQVGKELQKIGEIIVGSQLKAQVAIMQSYDTRFAFQIQPNNPRFGYENQIQHIYTGFFNANIPVDIISEKDPLAGYKVVIVPAMYVLTEKTARNLEQFAASGGLVVFTPRTGVKDEANAVVNMKLPGLIAEMAGVEVEEYISMPVDEDSQVQFCLPNLQAEFLVSVWADILKPTTAEVVARYSKDFYAGQAAATLNTFGKGKIIYLGALGDANFYESITNWILELADVKSLLNSPAGVEVTERWQGDQRLLFVLNHNDNAHEIKFGSRYLDLLSGEEIDHCATIAPREVLILVDTP
jgi:beta-galactosidase